jgi:polyamine oxidase
VAAGGYDDGRTDVPGAIARPVDRVIVVGAGLAGLTVANALAHAALDCVVLEARDRIGGRLHTTDLGGSPVDLGGSWIHHPIGNPLQRFAEQAGIACRAGNPLDTTSGYDRVDARRLTASELESMLTLQFEDFPEHLDDLRERLGPHATSEDGVAAYLADLDLPATAERRARQALRGIIEADAADSYERQSLRWMWTELEYGGDLFGDLPVGGYASIVEALAEGVDVRTSAVVADIATSSDGVEVAGADGTVEKGSHAVVTVPLGVLKDGAIRFSPPLPDERRSAIGRVGFGTYEKVALAFDHAFWREADLSHLMILPERIDEPAIWLFDLDAFGAGPVLVFHLFHSAARYELGRLDDDVVDWACGVLSDAVGFVVPAPTAVAITSWASDPFSLGAYTHLAPESDPSDIDVLARPVEGRLLFAGEHTQKARMGYADGAMSSGVREAKRLLGQASVQLGRRG